MAGDRRATMGNQISNREMEKVVEADRYSGVAIAGTAGPAMDMIKVFQLQLEHFFTGDDSISRCCAIKKRIHKRGFPRLSRA